LVMVDGSLLRQLSVSLTSRAAYPFQPSPAIGWLSGGARSLTAGQNPRGGAAIDYFFKAAPTSTVKLELRDARGTVIRTYTSDSTPADTAKKTAVDSIAARAREAMKDSLVYEPADSIVPARAGTNRFVWNLRYPGAKKLKNTLHEEGTLDGPVAPPGTYAVRLIVGRDTLARQFTVVADPRVTTTAAELAKQFELTTKVRDRITDVSDAVGRIEDLQAQLDQRVTQAKEQPYAKRVSEASKALRAKLEVARAELYEVGCHVDQCSLDQPMKLYNMLITVNGQVQTGDYPPTKQHEEMFADFSARIGEQLRKLQQLEDDDLVTLNRLLAEVQLPVVFVPPKRASTM